MIGPLRDHRGTSWQGDPSLPGRASERRRVPYGIVRRWLAIATVAVSTTGDAESSLPVRTFAHLLEAGRVSLHLPSDLATSLASVGVADADRVTVAAWDVRDDVLGLTVRLAGSTPDTFTTLVIVAGDGQVSTLEIGRVTVVPAPLPHAAGLRVVSIRTHGEGHVLATVVVRNDGPAPLDLTSIVGTPAGIDAVQIAVDGVGYGTGRSIEVPLEPGEEREITWSSSPTLGPVPGWLQVDGIVHGRVGDEAWSTFLGFRMERRP